MERWDLNKVILLTGAALVVAGLAINIALAPEMAAQSVPFLPGVVAALVLVFWARPWLYLVAGILTAAFPLVIVFVFGASGAITHPGGGLEGFTISMWLVGALLALLGGVMGLVQGRAQPVGGLGHWQGIAAIVLVAMLAGYGVANGYATTATRDSTLRTTSYAESVDERVTVYLTGTAFAPNSVTIPAGKLVALDVDNRDAVLHTFSYHLADGVHEQPVYPQTVSTIYLKFDTPQTIHVWCAPHSQGQGDRSEGSMWMDLVVA